MLVKLLLVFDWVEPVGVKSSRTPGIEPLVDRTDGRVKRRKWRAYNMALMYPPLSRDPHAHAQVTIGKTQRLRPVVAALSESDERRPVGHYLVFRQTSS